MKNFTLMVSLLLVLGGVTACRNGGPGPSQSPEAEVTAVGRIVAPRSHAEMVSEIRGILLSDAAIQQMTAARVNGTDYWINVSVFTAPTNGDDGGMADILFAAPTSFEGQVPIASDPCSGRGEFVKASDPCLQERRTYATAFQRISDVTLIHTQVDVARQQVVRLFPGGTPPANMIPIFINQAEEQSQSSP
jgi:hypothetical protein